MMTILGTGTMFGSTNVNDKLHKTTVVVVNQKCDHMDCKDHMDKKDKKHECQCKTCMELRKQKKDHKSVGKGNDGKKVGKDVNVNKGMNNNVKSGRR